MTMRSLRLRYWSLLVLRWLPVGFISPILVLLLLERGVGLAELGPVLGTYSLVTLLAELPTGGMADAYGRRRVLLASSLLMLGFLVIVLIADGVIYMTLGAMLGGASRALDSGPLEAWFVESARAADPDANIERELARGGAIDGISLAIGALAGGLLGTASGGELNIVLAAAMVGQTLHVVAAFFLMGGISGVPTRSPGALQVIRDAKHLIMGSRVLVHLLVAGLSVGISLISVEHLFQPRFEDLLDGRPSTTAILGVLLATSFAASALGAEVGPRLRLWRRWSTGRFLFGVAILQACCFVLMALARSAVLTAAAIVGVYALLGLAHPVVAAALHEATPNNSRTTVVSAQSLSMQVGAFLGAISLAPLAAATSIPVAWAAAAALMVVAGVWYLGLDQGVTTRRNPDPTSSPAVRPPPSSAGVGVARIEDPAR